MSIHLENVESIIEEIAFKKGYISEEKLYNLAKPLMKNDYGKYLMRLLS